MEKIQQSKSSLLQSCGFRIDTDHHRVERDRYIFTAPFIINGILEKAVIAQTGKVLRQQADVLHVHQFFLACLGSIAVNPGFHTGFHPYDKIVAGLKNRIAQHEHYNHTKNIQSSFHIFKVVSVAGKR